MRYKLDYEEQLTALLGVVSNALNYKDKLRISGRDMPIKAVADTSYPFTVLRTMNFDSTAKYSGCERQYFDRCRCR